MISDFKLINMTEDQYQIRAQKEHRDDQFMYKVTFKPAESSLNMDLSSSDVVNSYLIYDTSKIDNPNLGSKSFKIKRGLYDVYIEKILSVQNGKPIIEEGSRARYPKQIMVGDRYRIGYRAIAAISFNGISGLRVQMISKEHPLDNQTIYYTIDRDPLQGIKYYVPFNNQKKIEFFIQGITVNEFLLGTDNDSFEMVQA